MTILFTTVDGLKRAAKKVKRETGLSHTASLDHVARQGGYQNFVHASRNMISLPSDISTKPTFLMFPVMVTAHWIDRNTNAFGKESLMVHLSQRLDTLLRSHHFVGYFYGCSIISENNLDKTYRYSDRASCYWNLCKLVRALQFVDITGLRPTKSLRSYPKSTYQNRPPHVDHEYSWYHQPSKQYVLTDEPYQVSSERRTAWCNEHNFEIVQSNKSSIYGRETLFYLIGRRGSPLDLKGMVQKWDAVPTAAPNDLSFF